ncbi:stage 0 sporulation family protein [candidate division KSB1 bacterium]
MYDYVEIEFKGNRRAFYTNPEGYPVLVDDFVIIRAEKGEDVGRIYRLYDALPKELEGKPEFDVLRRATDDDLRLLAQNRIKEGKAKSVTRKYIEKHGLDMKLVSIEYQLDANKITFYFTAEQRVDFRELVKDLASEFKARIELRQIGVRDEARMLGGCGICGLQLCCTTCIRDFSPISTQYAKDQMLSANPSKLSGNCGRLRCCLLFEHNFYTEEIDKFPEIDSVLKTPKGAVKVEKVDVFREIIYLRYEDGVVEQATLEQINEYSNN